MVEETVNTNNKPKVIIYIKIDIFYLIHVFFRQNHQTNLDMYIHGVSQMFRNGSDDTAVITFHYIQTRF